MILSHSSQIAIKSIVHICETDSRCVNVRELSEITGENTHTTAKVLQNLVKLGILSSVTGPRGGFYLTQKQLQENLSEIIKSIDGADIFDRCVLGLSKCSGSHPCPVHNSYSPVRKEIASIFKKIRLSELTSISDKRVFLK